MIDKIGVLLVMLVPFQGGAHDIVVLAELITIFY
jgi:hypothetical protein